MSTENTPGPRGIEAIGAGTGKAHDYDYDYDFTIGQVLSEGWQRVSGLKGPFWIAAILVFVIVLLAAIVLTGIGSLLGINETSGPGMATALVVQLAITAIIYPFMAGFVMMGVRRSVDLPVSYNEVFAYFAYVIPLVLAAILMSLLMMLGFILLIIPGIYLAVAYIFTLLLIVDRNMGAWEAMETSRSAVTRHWFKVFFTLVIMGLIFMVSMIPLGLGLIWTYPMMVSVMGIMYRETFGVTQAS